jgi:hypothetical protein
LVVLLRVFGLARNLQTVNLQRYTVFKVIVKLLYMEPAVTLKWFTTSWIRVFKTAKEGSFHYTDCGIVDVGSYTGTF